ncbi:MAG: caspase family protein [Proteobacteria bacterium]|nr:caspase family protein [Pseudomonadota bacterium]
MLARLYRHMTGLILILALAVAASVVPSAASADGNRVALVIGNGGYGADIGNLRNPANDAKLMARALKKLGFNVTLALDVDQREMKRRIRDFGAALSSGGSQTVGLFYYAGHGLQVDGENFLLPIGAEIQREGDVSVEAVSANTVLAQMQYGNANGVNLVFLDACRNNPLSRGFRSATRGLARVDAPRGSFVGYSTAPGDVSVDGNGDNSPYALALSAELLRPGEAIEEVHRAVRLQVLSATNQQQTPWDSSSLTATVTLAGAAQQAAVAAPAPAPAPVAAPAVSNQGAAFDWENVKDSSNPAVFKAFLQQYPTGVYAALAQDKLDKLGGASQQVASATPQPAPVQQALRTTAPAEPPAPAAVETASIAPTDGDNGILPMEGAYLATKSANIRAEPNAKAKVIGKLKAEESVTVTGRSADAEWLEIATGAGTGYVSAKLLKIDNSVAMIAPAPAPEPLPPPAPEPQVNVQRISEEFKQDVETFIENSKEQKANYRFLAVSRDGARIGISTGCKKMKTSWGGWASEGCGEEAQAKAIALEKCGDDCRIIYNGINKIGDFEIEWQ